jgi:hypothetical protein
MSIMTTGKKFKQRKHHHYHYTRILSKKYVIADVIKITEKYSLISLKITEKYSLAETQPSPSKENKNLSSGPLTQVEPLTLQPSRTLFLPITAL